MLADNLAAKYATHPDFEDLRQAARVAELQGGGATRIAGAIQDELRRSNVVRAPRKRAADGSRYMGTVALTPVGDVPSRPTARESSDPKRFTRITPRQAESLRLAAAGLPRKEIAHEMGIGKRALETHMSLLYKRLGVHDLASAILEGQRRGLLIPEAPTSDLGCRVLALERKVLRLRRDLAGLRRRLRLVTE